MDSGECPHKSPEGPLCGATDAFCGEHLSGFPPVSYRPLVLIAAGEKSSKDVAAHAFSGIIPERADKSVNLSLFAEFSRRSCQR